LIGLSILEVFDACGLLFGPEVEISLDFLKYLEPSGLRSAYRKKALETHPDRARALGRDEAKMSERFREATLAYERLIPIVRNKGAVLLRGQSRAKRNYEKTNARHQPKKGFSDLFYTKEIPKRELLLGQFLYYSGFISWRTLMRAITWQRRQRPLIGQIALGWNMISRNEIQRILMWRNFSGKFGERAIRLGYLSRFQLMALLGKQHNLQCPIGEFFVNERILRPQDIKTMVERQKIHNRDICWRGTR
jgi:hypothetical protein